MLLVWSKNEINLEPHMWMVYCKDVMNKQVEKTDNVMLWDSKYKGEPDKKTGDSSHGPPGVNPGGKVYEGEGDLVKK